MRVWVHAALFPILFKGDEIYLKKFERENIIAFILQVINYCLAVWIVNA